MSLQSAVPALHTYHFEIPTGEMLVFPLDRHRTSWVCQNLEQTAIHIFIGSNDVPADIDHWFHLSAADDIKVINFDRGVLGPVYIAESGAGAGAITIISPLIEIPTTMALPA